MNKTPIETIRQTPANIAVPVIIISLSTIIFALVIDYSSTHIFNEFIRPLGKGDIDAEGVSTLISMFSVIAFPLAFIGTYFSTKFIKVEFSEKNIKQIGYYSSVSIVVVLALLSSPFVIGGIAYSIFLLPKLLRKWLKQMISKDPYNQPSSVTEEPSL